MITSPGCIRAPSHARLRSPTACISNSKFCSLARHGHPPPEQFHVCSISLVLTPSPPPPSPLLFSCLWFTPVTQVALTVTSCAAAHTIAQLEMLPFHHHGQHSRILWMLPVLLSPPLQSEAPGSFGHFWMPYHVFLIACRQEVNCFPFSSLFCFLKYIALNTVLWSPGCTHFSRSQQAVWAEKVKPESPPAVWLTTVT